jgi:hypothetical protein
MNTRRTTMPPLDERRSMCSIPVTLDGQPARIQGSSLPQGWIVTSTRQAEFSWPTIVRVIELYDGQFRS